MFLLQFDCWWILDFYFILCISRKLLFFNEVSGCKSIRCLFSQHASLLGSLAQGSHRWSDMCRQQIDYQKTNKKNKNIKIINELWYAVCVVVTVTCKEYSRVVLPQHFWMNAIGSWGTAGSSQQGRRRGPTGWSAHECLQALCLYVFFFLYFFINSFPDGFVEWWDGFGVDMPYCRFVLESGIFSTLAHA